MARFDVVVIGLGVMGSAALHRLAVRGVRVLGIERYEPGHDRGSSHGATRMIRLGYFEHPSYVSLLRDVYPLWRELEAKIGRRLLHTTGIAEIGAPESELVKGTLAAARQHALPHDVLDATALMRRYPAFRVPGDFVGVVQPDGGFLEAEPALLGLVKLARAGGAGRSGMRDFTRAPAVTITAEASTTSSPVTTRTPPGCGSIARTASFVRIAAPPARASLTSPNSAGSASRNPPSG